MGPSVQVVHPTTPYTLNHLTFPAGIPDTVSRGEVLLQCLIQISDAQNPYTIKGLCFHSTKHMAVCQSQYITR